MLRKGISQLVSLNNRAFYFMSEQRLMLKREKEAKLAQIIKDALQPTFIKVDDITIGSNSCGQMYNITVESSLFSGKTRVQQHKMVTACLAEELKSIHGYNLKTKAPEEKPATQEIKVEKKKASSQDKIDQ